MKRVASDRKIAATLFNATPIINSRATSVSPVERARDSGEGLVAGSGRMWLSALALLVITFIVGGAVAAAGRGPWVDEFWTLWQSQHDIPFAEVFRQRWLNDFHPPLFSIVHWLSTSWIGDSLLLHRLLNLLPLALALGFGVTCARRYARSFDVVALYAVLLLSFPVVLHYFTESRSYFWQVCIVFVVVGSFVVIGDQERDFGWERDRSLALFLLASIALAFNTHYFASLLAGIVAFGFAALCWRRGQRRWGQLIAAGSALSCAPLVLFVAVQHRFLSEESTHYWATGGAREAVELISGAVNSALGANPVGSFAAAAALLLWVAGSVGGRNAGTVGRFAGSLAPSRRRREMLVLLAAGLLVFSLCLLVLQSRQPIIVTRYLISLQAMVVGLCAIVAAPLFVRWRTMAWLLVVFAIAASALGARRAEREARWDATAKAAAAAAHSCSSAVVHGIVLDKKQSSRNFRPVLGWAYERYAQFWGFKAKALPVGQSPALQDNCPLIVWVEHLPPDEIQQAVDDPGSVLSGFGIDVALLDLTRARTSTGRSGFVLVVPQRGSAVSPI